MPVISATREAEAGELLEPGGVAVVVSKDSQAIELFLTFSLNYHNQGKSYRNGIALKIVTARYGGSHLQSQHFGRLRWEDSLRPGVPDQPGWIMRSGVQDQPAQDGKTLSLLKIQKSQAQWQVPVILATREAEAGESLELRTQRLQ
ncbi:hypothetical protein AAY473_004357 [Plecturocebus cupreus]